MKVFFNKTSLFILGHHGSAGQHPAGRGGLAARGHRLVQQPGGRQALRLAHQEGGAEPGGGGAGGGAGAGAGGHLSPRPGPLH